MPLHHSPAFAPQALFLVPSSPPHRSPTTSPRPARHAHRQLSPSLPRPSRFPASPPAHAPLRPPRPRPPARRTPPPSQPPARPASRPPSRHAALWDARHAELLAFFATHGHVCIPRTASHTALYRWVRHQQYLWRRGKLSADKFRRLSAVPSFTWDAHYELWKASFFELAAFHDAHGHCSVPLRGGDSADTRRLARWVAKQRYLAKHGLLEDGRRRRLEGLGFAFAPDAEKFAERLEQLQAMRKDVGHANVPLSWPDDPGLARWAETVRRRWRQGKLPAERQRMLVDMGFSFVLMGQVAWDAHFAAFEAFVRKNGHAVPTFVGDAVLYRWCALQRKEFLAGDLAEERRRRLEQLGFEFRPWKEAFAERLGAMRVFYQENGHCRVPEDDALYLWASQLRARGMGMLAKKHQRDLNAIEFPWE